MQPPFEPAPPPLVLGIPPQPSRQRAWLHLALLAATFVTLCLNGGLFWGDTAASIKGFGDFFDIDLLRRGFVEGLPYGIWVTIVLGAHEMGHYFACRYYGIPASLPYFIPGPPMLVGSFGAVIRIRARIPHRRALFDVAAAGPLAGFVIALPLFVIGLLRASPQTAPPPVTEGLQTFIGGPVLYSVMKWFMPGDAPTALGLPAAAGWVGMLVTSLNLFPVGQLDGGHAAYALSRRIHRILARASIVSLIGLIVYQTLVLRQAPAYALWLVILVWMRDRHPRLIDEDGALGLGRRLVAILLLAIFVLSFIPVPLIVIDAPR